MVKNTDASPNGNSQKENTQVMKAAFEGLRNFTSTASFKGALSILDELASAQAQLAEKEKELAQAKEAMSKKEESHLTAISEIFKTQKMEITKQEAMQAKIDTLEAGVQERDKRLEGKNQETDQLNEKIKGLEESCKSGKENIERANGEITDLQNNLKKRDERIEKLKKAGAECKKQLTEKTTQNEELEGRVSSLEKSLKTSNEDRDKLKGLFVGFTKEPEEPMIDRYDELWPLATKEVWSLLKDDLPDPILQNSGAWGHFKREAEEILDDKLGVELPPSNTKAAKCMRLVAVLAMLARQIDYFIFQPTYIGGPAKDNEDDGQNNFREFSATKLAEFDEEREAYCRTLLSSIQPEKQAGWRTERIQRVIETIYETFALILPDDKKNDMKNMVTGIVNKAADTWKPIQRSKTRYETDFEPVLWGDKDWDPFAFPDEPIPDDIKNIGKPVLTIFPRISKISEKEGRQGLTYVQQVGNMMPLYLAAEKEIMPEPPSPISRRFHGTRVRRESLAMNGTGHQNGNGNEKVNGNSPFLDKSRSG